MSASLYSCAIDLSSQHTVAGPLLAALTGVDSGPAPRDLGPQVAALESLDDDRKAALVLLAAPYDPISTTVAVTQASLVSRDVVVKVLAAVGVRSQSDPASLARRLADLGAPATDVIGVVATAVAELPAPKKTRARSRRSRASGSTPRTPRAPKNDKSPSVDIVTGEGRTV